MQKRDDYAKYQTNIRFEELYRSIKRGKDKPAIEDLIEHPTDYRYLVVKPNYIFYRIEDDTVRVIRILNQKQDFLQILFGISSISKEGEDYWGD